MCCKTQVKDKINKSQLTNTAFWRKINELIYGKAENIVEQIKPYKKSCEYSYTLGAFPTIELIKNVPESVLQVIISPELDDRALITELCNRHRIPMIESKKQVERLSDKENVYIIGVFRKFEKELRKDAPHIVLVNPSNMGNLGTIIRTAIGFGIHDIAMIEPAADIYNPKVVRASMGALFHMNFKYFDNFEAYAAMYDGHEFFPFMLDADKTLVPGIYQGEKPFSLIFGNEATGLDAKFHGYGTSVLIPQSSEVDSLNITVAVAVAAYVFTEGRL